jgi:hypothetical protein
MVSEKGREKLKGIAFIALGIFLIGVLIYGFSFFDTQITGKSIFDLDANYVEGEPLEGVLSLSMKKGELVPASSVVVFETAGERYEYALAEIVSGKVVDGNFYVDGVNVSGEGEGYGVEGVREVYPSVSFTLDIFQEEESTGGSSETSEEEISEPPISNDSGESEVVSVEVVLEEEVVEEEIPEEEVVEEEVIEEEIPEEEAPETSPITGQVSLKLEIEVDGEVFVDNPFSYNLQEGESVRIKKGSVKVGSTKLSEDVLNLDVSNGVVSVTTEYFEVEQGFGEKFLAGEGESLDIDLSALGLVFGQGDLKVSLIYGEEEIVSLTVFLEEGIIESEEAPEVLEEVEANVTEENVSIESKNLTEIQIGALVEEFGEVSVKTTKSELVGDRLVVRYELGQYWVEYSYDYDDVNLESLVEAERVAWLSDLADTLEGDVVVFEDVAEFGGDFDLVSVGSSS